MRILSIDLSSGRNLNILYLKRLKKKFEIIYVDSVSIEPSQKEELKEVVFRNLQNALKKIQPKPHQTILVLPRKKVSIKALQFPPIEEKHIKKAVHLEVEHLIPSSLEETAYDYKVSPINLLTHKRHIIFGSTKKNTIFDYINLLSELKLSPSIITISSTNIFYLCKKATPAFSEGKVILLNLSSENVEIYGIINGDLLLNKMTDIPSSSIKDEIQAKKTLSIKYLTQLKGEIERTSTYCFSQIDKKDLRPSMIMIVGMEYNSQNVIQRLKQILKSNVTMIDPLKSFLINSGHFPESSRVLSTISSAILMATDPKKVLNLIPLSEKELRQKRRLEIIKLAANITFVITLIIGIFCANLYTINKKTELLQNKLNSLKPTIADILKTKKEHEKLCKQLEFFKTNFFQQPSYLVVLREIQLVLPKNIWLNSITLKDTKLQNMEGFCLGSAADVLRRLDMSRLFYKVEFKGAIVKSKFNGFDVDKFNLKANILKNIKSIPLGGK